MTDELLRQLRELRAINAQVVRSRDEQAARARSAEKLRDDAIAGRDDLPMAHELLALLKRSEARLETAETELAEAREDVARCAADTTAVDLAQDVEFLKAEKEQMRERIAAILERKRRQAWALERADEALRSIETSPTPFDVRPFRRAIAEALVAEPARRWWYVLEIAERPVDEDGLGPTYRLVVNALDPGRDGRWLAETGDDAIRLTGRDGIFAVVACDDIRVVRHPEIHPARLELLLERRSITAERDARERIHDRPRGGD